MAKCENIIQLFYFIVNNFEPQLYQKNIIIIINNILKCLLAYAWNFKIVFFKSGLKIIFVLLLNKRANLFARDRQVAKRSEDKRFANKKQYQP